MRLREIRCICGGKLGQIRKPAEGRVSWEHKCRSCKRVVEITITPDANKLRYLDPEPRRSPRPLHVQ